VIQACMVFLAFPLLRSSPTSPKEFVQHRGSAGLVEATVIVGEEFGRAGEALLKGPFVFGHGISPSERSARRCFW